MDRRVHTPPPSPKKNITRNDDVILDLFNRAQRAKEVFFFFSLFFSANFGYNHFRALILKERENTIFCFIIGPTF
jgi:hypothetical protein